MKLGKRALIIVACSTLLVSPAIAAEQKNDAAKEISATAEMETGHPEVAAGLSCNDCHEVKYDANTTATQVWLYDDSPGLAKGEGVMTRQQVWQEIEQAIGGIKKDSNTYILGTCLNNVPLTTTCEWTLDPKTHCWYGFHEKGTEKLNHIKANPRVSMNYHHEFDNFADFLCVQIRGTAELIESDDPRFEQLMIDILPYEDGARVPSDATPEQRAERLTSYRQSLKGSFVISKIIPRQITIANGNFRRNGYRVYQRWLADAPATP